MKIILTLILLFLSQSLFYSMNNPVSSEKIDLKLLETIRETYYASVENEDLIDTLETLLAEKFGTETDKLPVLILAYYGAIDAVKSKHAFWPFSKMNYLSSSMEYFEKALKKAPTSLEIRFMRFSILHYVPGILGYSEERDLDINMVYNLLLRKNYSEVDYKLQVGIAEFLVKSERLSEERIAALNNVFSIATLD